MSPPTVAVGPKIRLLSLIAAVVLAIDVITKTIAVAELEGGPPVELLGGAVYLVLVRNPGMAWSMATGYTWVISLIVITVVVVLLRVARRLRSTPWAVALGLVLGGALGNLSDRIFRAPGPLLGHVVDMVSPFAPDGSVFPVFNVADSSVFCGGVLLVLLALTGRELDGTRNGRAARAAADAAAVDDPPTTPPATPPTTPPATTPPATTPSATVSSGATDAAADAAPEKTPAAGSGGGSKARPADDPGGSAPAAGSADPDTARAVPDTGSSSSSSSSGSSGSADSSSSSGSGSDSSGGGGSSD